MARLGALAIAGCMAGLPPAALAAPAATSPKNADVTIREWDLPSPDSRPHDPAVGPDGALWYTAQRVNRLGRLDPATGQIQEYPLPTYNSGPHGLTAAADG